MSAVVIYDVMMCLLCKPVEYHLVEIKFVFESALFTLVGLQNDTCALCVPEREVTHLSHLCDCGFS